MRILRIGVNAAGVAGVATPQYFDKCFFPSAELLNTASRCHFHLQCVQCTVFNSPVEHMNLKNNTPRMHHVSRHFEKKTS